jgi:NTE family protein
MGCIFSCLLGRNSADPFKDDVLNNNPINPNAKFDHKSIKNLAFSGGSANGIVYVGVYRRLKELDIPQHLHGIAGTSVGSIFATFCALNVSHEYIYEKVMELDTEKVIDDSWGVLRDLDRLDKKLGYCPGDYLREWVEDRLSELTSIKNITFTQLHGITGKHLKIVVWNENKLQCEYWDHITQPNMAISFAIRTSTSLPFIFVPQYYNGCIYVDGGIGDTYPLGCFPNDGTTFGVMVMDPLDKLDPRLVTEQKVESLIDHMMAIYTSMSVNTFRMKHPPSEKWYARTIAIRGAGKKIWDFKFTNDEKIKLINQSYIDALEFI